MPGIDSFADIVRAVSDIWGLLALAVLVLGVLALQMTKGAHPNVRVLTFLVILAVFVLCLYMALTTYEPDATRTAGNGDVPLTAEGLEAREESARDYSESLDNAYGSAADRMNDIAGQIAGQDGAESTDSSADDESSRED